MAEKDSAIPPVSNLQLPLKRFFYHMQRIKIRYQRSELSNALSRHELREALLHAAQQAAILLTAGKRSLLMGPPLAKETTSEAEYALFSLEENCEPNEFVHRLAAYLPDGIIIEAGWVCKANGSEENPSLLDEAVYQVIWHDAIASEKITAAIRQFYSESEVSFIRNRDNKKQYLNARNLVHQLTLLAMREGVARLQMTLAAGSQSSIRPHEVLEAVGFSIAPAQLQIHRIAMFSSAWRKSNNGMIRLLLD